MAANREAQRKATHNEGAANSILKVIVYNRCTCTYVVIITFPTKYKFVTSKTNNLFAVWGLSIHAVNV